MIELQRQKQKILLRETLFWDINPETLDAGNSMKIIIERVITRGNLDEFKQLINFYTNDELKETVLKIGNLDSRTLNFISGFLELPVSNFLCYKKKQLNPAHWNS